jgi:hypothetical protein
MNPLRRFAFLLLLTPVQVAYAQHGGASASVPAAAAPKEARQFDFLIGHWEIELTPKVNSLAAMIHGAPRLLGSWKAWSAFDGFGIDDELRVVDGSGNPVTLTHALRIYDARSGRWLISGLDVYRARFSSASGAWQTGEMHINGTGSNNEGKPYLSRTRFFEISEDGFRMQQDRSFDGGGSWDEAVVAIVAKRVAAKAAR